MSRVVSASGETLGVRLLGFDADGEVFDRGDVVFRRIRDGRKADVAALHGEYERARLDAMGIVETRLRGDGHLEHRKLTASYPYEWPARMYRDAVLFHLRLLADLDRAGLTLKDALPNNVLFDDTRPVFVDFLSLLPTAKLREEAWLGAAHYTDPRFMVLTRMLLPYMILPLVFMARGQFSVARDLLSWRSCNCDGKPPSWLELVRPNRRPGLGWLLSYPRSLLAAAGFLPVRLATGMRRPDAYARCLASLIRRVEALRVAPPKSAYSAYYDEKREALSLEQSTAFLPKQRSVAQVLGARAPHTVVDLGANTGWFSLLAARHGARVIALEEDESCVDILYGRAKEHKLPILPLKLSFGELTREIQGSRTPAAAFDYSQVGPQALYRAGVERLGGDMALVLGLVHHLVLGEGRTIESVFEILSKLAAKTLVVEFIALEDDKIREDPGFFPNLRRFDATTYNAERVRQAGLRHYARVETHASHPASRSLLVFDRP